MPNNKKLAYSLQQLKKGSFDPRHATMRRRNLGLPSTLIRHENGAFRLKRSSNKRNLKKLALRFSVAGTESFWKRTFFENDDVTITAWFSDKVYLEQYSKITIDFSGEVSRETVWCVFRVKTPFSNFSGVACTRLYDQSALIENISSWWLPCTLLIW